MAARLHIHPLGGNRKGTARTYLNNFATMLIGGLWHGAAWKFVFWGAMHGAGLAVHKASKPVLGRIGDSWPVRAASWLVTMTFVAFCGCFSARTRGANSWTVVSSVFRDFSAAYIPAFAAARSLWLILMLVIVVSHCLPTRFWESAQAWFVRSPWIVKLLIFIVVGTARDRAAHRVGFAIYILPVLTLSPIHTAGRHV